MYKPLSLRKNFSWTFAGNVVNTVSLWGIVAVATRLVDADVVGRFELSRVIALSLMAVTMPSLRTILVTDAKNQYSFADYLGARLALTILSVFGFVIVGWCWYGGQTAWIILLWGLAKCTVALARGKAHRDKRQDIKKREQKREMDRAMRRGGR